MVHNMVLNVVLNLVLNSISFFRTESTYFQELCKVSKQKNFFCKISGLHTSISLNELMVYINILVGFQE